MSDELKLALEYEAIDGFAYKKSTVTRAYRFLVTGGWDTQERLAEFMPGGLTDDVDDLWKAWKPDGVGNSTKSLIRAVVYSAKMGHVARFRPRARSHPWFEFCH